MLRQDLYRIRKCGRVCYPFPWESAKVAAPWKAGYMRVMIPLTEQERRHSEKKCHIQIVRITKLEKIQEARLSV